MTDAKLKPYEYYMEILVNLAKKNPSAPFAAMIVDANSGEILCQGLNNSPENPTLHGEVVAINNFSRLFPYRRFQDTILITTAETCPMCASAIVWAKISTMVYGTSIPFLTENGWGQIQIRAEEVFRQSSSFFKGKIVGGVLHEKTDPLFIRGTGK